VPRGARPLRRALLITLWLEIALLAVIIGLQTHPFSRSARAAGSAALFAHSAWVGTALLSAVVVFLIVRCWCVRGDLTHQRPGAFASWANQIALRWTGTKPPIERRRNDAPPTPRPFHGWARGMTAAILHWAFTCALAPDQSWSLACVAFLFALLAASYEKWLVTGVATAVAVMTRPDMLAVAPVLVLWPLFTNAPRATFRLLAGFVATVAVIGSPELVGAGRLWVAGVILVPLLVRPAWPGGRPLASPWLAIPIAVELIAWPLMLPANRDWRTVAALAAVAVTLIGVSRWRAYRWLPAQAAVAVAAALFCCPLLFGGSFEILLRIWCEATQAPVATSNVATLLQTFLAIPPARLITTIDLPAFCIRASITVAHALSIAFAVTTILSAASAAIRSERRDPRLLVSLTAPLVLAAALLTPAPGPIWAAAACCSALWVASGSAMTVAAVALTAVAWCAGGF
jgi:hypothetical protein